MQPVTPDGRSVAWRLHPRPRPDTLRAAYRGLKRMKNFLKGALLALAACAAAFPAVAIEALKLTPDEKIVLDGRLDEPAWQRAQKLDRFWEIFPQAEVEPRVKTEAWYAYDSHALYV